MCAPTNYYIYIYIYILEFVIYFDDPIFLGKKKFPHSARDIQRSLRKHLARDIHDNDVTHSEDHKNAPALT